MNIYSAEFVTSATDWNKCPLPTYPEFAFIGRSNVGKSSLINMLVNKKGLAKTSGTPGKTQTINHFVVNGEQPKPWFLVDLPGYGYAKVAKTSRKSWSKFIMDYLDFRENLMCTMVLIDSRHPPQKIDIEFLVKLGTMGLAFAIVFTKADKVKPAELVANMEVYKAKLLEYFNTLPTYFITSAESWDGKEELLAFLEGVLNIEQE
jgi:GTP-binding protein